MFHFPSFASRTSTRYLAYAKWVSPFRNLRITGYLPPPRSFSQAITSFIASDCQGIHRMRFFTWPYNPKQSGYTMKTTFAENLQLLTNFTLAWINTSESAIQSNFLLHTQIFKERSNQKIRNQHSPSSDGMLISKLYDAEASLWWSQAGSNRWPPACKAGALPAELSPQKEY